jgi:malate dehydrogenase (oxaloacetate-decarboxylating)(NADP+)
MVKSMAKNPIIFAMANPDPEISPIEVEETRDDAIVATGRSDYPNQVNNFLCFPYLFRGLLDVQAKKVAIEICIKIAEVLARIAKMETPQYLKDIYKNENL